jgi:hypothetical protein
VWPICPSLACNKKYQCQIDGVTWNLKLKSSDEINWKFGWNGEKFWLVATWLLEKLGWNKKIKIMNQILNQFYYFYLIKK